MRRARLVIAIAVAVLVGLGIVVQPVAAKDDTRFRPGAPGAGDPYFPTDGNGGYDVSHYDLDVRYDPATDTLTGVASIQARATQDLSRFNLDLDGLTVHDVEVAGQRATWRREGTELVITPRRGIRDGHRFRTVIRYSGVPRTLADGSGFIHTDDGALIIGEPDVAATWYPVNDHPIDKASYTFRVTVPRGREAVANGRLVGSRNHGRWTTWTWDAKEPVASYLTTASVGEFDIDDYRIDGVKFWDALDPDLFDPVGAPRTGSQFAYSDVTTGQGASYKRLTRTFDVPAGGGELSFWVDRQTESDSDYLIVEAHPVGSDDWTTLPDLEGHTSKDIGDFCLGWQFDHPFLAHYQTENPDGCSPTGTTGEWNAASGESNGYENWRVDLGAYAGGQVEVAIGYVSDFSGQRPGLLVDDVSGPGGQGSTSFEADSDPLDGWTVSGPPAGSAPNQNDWAPATVDALPLPDGVHAQATFDRHDEILALLTKSFGEYPFSTAGGIVDDVSTISFALENQTRPIYTRSLFSGAPNESIVVHELAHQWFGDSLALAWWRDIWLNEGFASYAGWLWSADQGLGTAQEQFDSYYEAFPAGDPFWELTIGDPGPDSLFDGAVYVRGAMTLHQLRLAVGDRIFFRILRTWAARNEGGNVTTRQFIRHAERISGKQLDELFQTWLFTKGRPEITVTDDQARRSRAVPPVAKSQLSRIGHR